MRAFHSAMVVSMMASVSPLAAQTALTERPGMWISVRPATSDPVPQVLTAPETAPLISAEPSGGVVLDATESQQGVILAHPSIAQPAFDIPTAQTPRPRPRPAGLITEAAADPVPEPESEHPAAIMVDLAYAGPRPSQRPREVAEPADIPLEAAVLEALEDAVGGEVATGDGPGGAQQVADAAALAAELAARLAGNAHDIMSAATRGEPDPDRRVEEAENIVIAASPAIAGAPRLAPTPMAILAVAGMSSRNQPAGLSAVLLPRALSGPRPAVQPAAFLVPREDAAPILSRPLPEGPEVMEAVSAPVAVLPPALSAALMPGETTAPGRVARLAFAAQPLPDMFPYSALPPELLPAGPDAQDRAIHPRAPVPEVMAAVLMTDPRPAPAPLAPLAFPDMPLAGDLPLDPDAGPELPAPDLGALERMIADAAICWQFADLSAEAGWASLSVDVALDEMNMPAAQSIRLTGFAHVMSSSAAEAFHAARGALVGCAEATGAEPATTAATLVFDRNGVRLR